jgi:hypothetical protein
MQGTFNLMDGDTHIGNFIIDNAANIWTYVSENDLEKQPLVFKLQLRKKNVTTLSGDVVRDWIVGRAPEPTYEFIDALMDKVGISKYDPLAFVQYNSGRFNKDTYYIVAQV